MKVKKYSVIFGLVFGLAQVSLASSYNPDQLAQFNSTNQCSSCDLSGATLSGNHSGAVFSSSNLTGVNGSGT